MLSNQLSAIGSELQEHFLSCCPEKTSMYFVFVFYFEKKSLFFRLRVFGITHSTTPKHSSSSFGFFFSRVFPRIEITVSSPFNSRDTFHPYFHDFGRGEQKLKLQQIIKFQKKKAREKRKIWLTYDAAGSRSFSVVVETSPFCLVSVFLVASIAFVVEDSDKICPKVAPRRRQRRRTGRFANMTLVPSVALMCSQLKLFVLFRFLS